MCPLATCWVIWYGQDWFRSVLPDCAVHKKTEIKSQVFDSWDVNNRITKFHIPVNVLFFVASCTALGFNAGVSTLGGCVTTYLQYFHKI